MKLRYTVDCGAHGVFTPEYLTLNGSRAGARMPVCLELGTPVVIRWEWDGALGRGEWYGVVTGLTISASEKAAIYIIKRDPQQMPLGGDDDGSIKGDAHHD